MQGLIWGAVGKALATTPLETWHPSSQEINVLMACMSRRMMYMTRLLLLLLVRGQSS